MKPTVAWRYHGDIMAGYSGMYKKQYETNMVLTENWDLPPIKFMRFRVGKTMINQDKVKPKKKIVLPRRAPGA